MSSAPTVAAIIPTRNRADRLAGALESVFDQSYERVEAIIVDGGSTDRTKAVVSNYRDEYGLGRVSYIRNEEPNGPSAARNQAADRTDARFLAFLDDDDRWHPQKIERQVTQFSDRSFDIGLSYTGRVSKTDTGAIIQTALPSHEGHIFPELLLYNHIGSPSRVMVPADVFHSVDGFDEEFEYHEDWDFYIRLARDYAIGSISDPLVTRISHSNERSKNIQELRHYLDKIHDRYRSALCFYGLYDQARARGYREIGIDRSQSGNTADGLRAFRKAFGYNPSIKLAMLCALTLLGPRGFRLGTSLKRGLNSYLGVLDGGLYSNSLQTIHFVPRDWLLSALPKRPDVRRVSRASESGQNESHSQWHRRIKESVKSNEAIFDTISQIYRTYLEFRGRIHQMRQLGTLKRQYDVFDVIQLDPADVTYKMPRWEGLHWEASPGTIRGGEWDRGLPLFEESDLFESFRLHFENGITWTETPYFELIAEESGWSNEEVLEFLERYDALYHDIAQHGYKSQLQLLRSTDTERRFLPTEADEVLVNIGRNGDYILDDGRHRLTIANLLKIDEIPACVLVRHRESV